MARTLTSVALFLMAVSFSAAAVYGWLALGSFWLGFGAAWFALLSLAGLGRQADKDRSQALLAQQLAANPNAPVDFAEMILRSTRSGDAKKPRDL